MLEKIFLQEAHRVRPMRYPQVMVNEGMARGKNLWQ